MVQAIPPLTPHTNANTLGSIPSFCDLELRSVAISIGESERKVCKMGSDLQETKPQPPGPPERVMRPRDAPPDRQG